MRRREFIAALGGTAAMPFAARAQKGVDVLVGFLHVASATGLLHLVDAVRQGITKSNPGGHGVTIESRWAAGNTNRLPALAAELARLQPAVIVAGGHAAALAANEPPGRSRSCL